MKKLLLSLIAAALLLTGCIQATTDPNQGTGYISGSSVNVSSELNGKIAEVFVEEGQTVEAGDLLFRLEDAILIAQKNQAEAGLATAKDALEVVKAQANAAQLQYDLAVDGAHAADMPARLQAWNRETAEDYQPAWYFEKSEQIEAAKANLERTAKELESKQKALEAEVGKVANKDFADLEKQLAEDEMAWDIARQTLVRAQATGDKDLEDAAQQVADEMESNFNATLKKYQNSLTGKDAEAILEKRSQLAVAQSQFDFARDQLLQLETGSQSRQVALAESALKQAQAGVAQAESMITEAEAALKLLELQLEKSTVSSPIRGTITALNLKAGEILPAGGIAMVVTPLDEVTLEVYMPETYYGQVKVGDVVSITTDSFPNQEFSGTVSRIANEAEFSPRNLQTTTTRTSSVYKVTISVHNPGQNLKPGMPADVVFKK